jgi:hypothetical protein
MFEIKSSSSVLIPCFSPLSLSLSLAHPTRPNQQIRQNKRDLEKLVDEINAGRPQCPVGLNTLVIPRKVTLGDHVNQPYVYLNCGHVQGKFVHTFAVFRVLTFHNSNLGLESLDFAAHQNVNMFFFLHDIFYFHQTRTSRLGPGEEFGRTEMPNVP